jgi:MFS family permease
MTQSVTSSPPVPAPRSPLTLFAPLGGTFFLRAGGGAMGILTGLFLNAKNSQMGSPDHPYFISATGAGLIIASFFLTELIGSFIAGNFIDKHGPRRYMIAGPLFGAGAMIVTSLLHLTRIRHSFNLSSF